jgi:multiple sugar transport system ATP-binding protein
LLGQPKVIHAGFAITLDYDPGLPEGLPLTVGIRPEYIALGSGPAEAVVELVEPTGLGTIAHLTLAGTALKAFTLARMPLTIGRALAIELPPHRLHLFDPQGARVGR